ncbi:hypothetical protein A4A49_08654 [Nicotiana attenuata]|uniref:Uncharacterized protein n=1 Tax=Nicotiana attenuata TaxID=49451 RepID=A0A314LI61_NICAT|nr:hypothetical protein A4A49_08654 [Nicotiana attenuata]
MRDMRKKNKEPSKSIGKKRTRSRPRLVDEDIPVSKKYISRSSALKGVDEGEEEDLDINAVQTQIEEQVSEKTIIEKEKDSDGEALGGEDDENGDAAAQEEVYPYLIPTLCEMDMDYIKNLVPYDDEVAYPIIDQLAVDLEWMTAIKKAPGAVSLETNGEVDIDDDDPLGGSIPDSPLVGGFSDIGRGGPCRIVIRLQSRLSNAPISVSKMRKLKHIQKKKPKVDVLKPVLEEDKKLFVNGLTRRKSFPKTS